MAACGWLRGCIHAQEALKRFSLAAGSEPQTYALGLKEVWEVPEDVAKPGTVVHTVSQAFKAARHSAARHGAAAHG